MTSNPAEAARKQTARVRSAPRAAACEWSLADADASMWEGTCGIAWTFGTEGPQENGCLYCPRCGGKLKVNSMSKPVVEVARVLQGYDKAKDALRVEKGHRPAAAETGEPK